MTALLKEAAERMYGIMDKVTRAFCSDASVRAWFRMDPAFADLCAMDAGYDCQIPLARVDIFLDEDTGSYTFCELNTDGSAGMVVTDAVCQAVRMTPSFEEFASNHPGFRQYDLCGSWIDALFETHAEWELAHPRRTEDSARSDDGVRVDEGPHAPQSKIYPASVAIVDYSESIDLEDAAHFVDLMRRRGVVARFADVRDLRIAEDESGARRLCDAAGPIDCVWRRAVTGELWDKPCEGRSALIEAAQEGLACIVGGFRTWPCATKTVFAFLWSRAGQSLLSSRSNRLYGSMCPIPRFWTKAPSCRDLSKRIDGSSSRAAATTRLALSLVWMSRNRNGPRC